MINSVNTLEFLKPKLISMDKLNTSSTTRIHHHPTSHTPTRTFYTFVTNSSDTLNSTLMISGEQRQLQQQQQRPSLRQERVKVQHLENHAKLQNNNCWNNFRTLLSASPCGTVGDAGAICQELRKEREYDLEVDDIQNKSAFTLEFNKRNIFSNSSNNNNIISKKRNEDSKSSSPNAIETNNNHFVYKHQNGFINKQPQPKTMMVILPRRTEDQEHAYRRIESVHNYAKLKSYDDEATDTQSPNGSRHSSYLDDEEDDEEEEEDDDDEEEDDDNNDADYYIEEDEMIDLDGDYEDIFNRRRFPKLSTSSTANVTKLGAKKSLNFMASQRLHSSRDNADDETDLQVDVDVETVENPANNTMAMMSCSGGGNDSPAAKPDHHARRPMNAFLIFCKRHRAIVKERYKTLENRAITKILGDWWASLDINDKKCFTSLAQQNKDAFFSANPNFKWYKLPAPPLRTLNTRPTNCNSTGGGGSGTVEYDESGFAVIESISNNTRSNTNYFKLADEAQMGDLSQLMQDKSKSKQCALQQALGETSQFMRSHITGPQDESNTEEKQQQLKRRFYNENSFSSNSSEEDGLVPKKKSARSCKGKIYQELINSGQIAAPAVKKSKSTQRLCGVETVLNDNRSLERTELRRHQEESSQAVNSANNAVAAVAGGPKAGASEAVDSMFSYDLSSFDLEEKIKELPALNLDDYLLRKRNTKKKKKFTTNGKKRGNRSNNSNNSNTINTICNAASEISGCKSALNASPQLGSPIPEHVTDCRAIQQRKQQQQQAVGSQKRKARKESITRRDVSAIEQEVASLLPLTINGCCYFQEASLPLSPVITSYKNVTIEKDTNSPTNTIAVEYFTAPTSPTIPLTTTIIASAPSSSTSPSPPQHTLAPPPPESIACGEGDSMNNTLNDNMISSTSDLLILAEVAANRTELKH